MPVAPALRHLTDRKISLESVLGGGDDYELCFTAPRARRGAVEGAGRRSRVAVTRIGRIVPKARGRSRVEVIGAEGKPLTVGA